MKLLFSGSHRIDSTSLKRLLLLAEEIDFMDRPSNSFGNFGTVGIDSPVRTLLPLFKDRPIKVDVLTPPSGAPLGLQEKYLETDLMDLNFRRKFLKGLLKDPPFMFDHISPEGNYGSGIKGREFIKALTQDEEFLTCPMNTGNLTELPWVIDNKESLKETLRTLLCDISIALTNAMVLANSTGLSPLANSKTFADLLTLRFSNTAYTGGVTSKASLLGLKIIESVIPDSVLKEISFDDVLHYREASKDIYDAWIVDVNKYSTDLEDIPYDEAVSRIPLILSKEIQPKIQNYKNEMKSVAEKLFGELFKRATYIGGGIMIHSLSGLSSAGAITAFFSSLAIKDVVDYIVQNRKVKREHAITYLLEL